MGVQCRKMKRELVAKMSQSNDLRAWKPIEPDPQPLERHPSPGSPGELNGGETYGSLLWA